MLGQLRRRNWETPIYLLLAVVNLAIGCFLIYAWPNKIISGDAEQYYEISKALVGKGGALYYDRTSWGYPIFLILTGVPWTRWPVITQVIQVCMASAIPYFVGSSLRQVGVASWISTTAAIASFLTLPTIFSIDLLTDTCGEFLFYLAIWLVARTLTRAEGPGTAVVMRGRMQWKSAAAIGAVFFLLYLIRPANALLALIGLGVGFAATAKAGRGGMLGAIGVLIVLTLAWVPLQKGWTAWAEAKAKQTFQTDGGLAGLLFFRNIYSAGPTFVGHSTIRPENGKCSSLVYESVGRNLGTIGNTIMKPSNQTATQDEIFAAQGDVHFAVIWKSVEHDFGPKEMDRIFWCAGFEGLYAEPKSLLYLYDGLVAFFLIDDVIYDYGYRQAWSSADWYAPGNFPFWRWAMYGGAVIKVIALLIAFATLVSTWQRGGSQRALAAMLWAMILYIAAVHVAFASAHWRYIMPVIPGLVLLAGLGLDALRKPTMTPASIDR
jgi:hypothetical protein